jgi:hypothetical protein
MSHTYDPWSDDHYAIAKQMWAAGEVASAIAKAVSRSRSAVLGKIKRCRDDFPGRLSGYHQARSIAQGPKKPQGRPLARKAAIQATIIPEEPEPLYEPLFVRLADISGNQCRAIVEGPARSDMTDIMCGAPVLRKMCCAYHHKLIYLPPVARVK